MTKKIFKSVMLVSAATTVLALAFVMGILYRYFDRQIFDELKQEAVYLARGVELNGEEYLEGIRDKNARITYLDESGKVLFDSQADVASMENHSDREEVQEAVKNGWGEARRMSGTLSEKTIYYALRLDDGKILRVSSTQYSVLALLLQLVQPMLWVVLLMLVLSGLFASRVSRRIVEPINELDLDHPEDNQVYDEVAPLLGKINRQSQQIHDQLETARHQQEEFTIITENMQEGLLVIDRYTMILSGNSSVWRFFQIKEPKNGESVYALDRSEEFRRIVQKVISGEHGSGVLRINGSYVQLIANPVTREEETVGAVLLLMNVTEKMERENLRREFSANVSHELKTPLTSISGYSEIMQEGFVREEDVKKIAGQIFRESQRLIRLVEDTIRISQLDEGEVPYEWESTDVYDLARGIFRSLKDTAQKKNVHLYIDGEHLNFWTVRPILEEILYNLCDNAVRYNREDGTVTIRIRKTGKGVRISVKDNGIGIPVEDQTRVFERFYCVDKSHSRENGGTGLGLSIAKHGVAFLGGTVELVSEEGKGTEVTVLLPEK